MTVPPPDPRSGDSDDIDAEFARMMQEMGASDAEAPADLTVEDILAAPSLPETAFDPQATLDPEADLAADEQAPEPIAVIATSVASAKALGAALRLSLDGRPEEDLPPSVRVHDTDAGAILVGALDEEPAHRVAAFVSEALQKLGIVVFWRRGDRMTATRYRAGERGDTVSPAVVLGGVDHRVEQLMLGAADLEDLGEGVDPRAITRMQAVRWVVGKGRRA